MSQKGGKGSQQSFIIKPGSTPTKDSRDGRFAPTPPREKSTNVRNDGALGVSSTAAPPPNPNRGGPEKKG